MRICILTLSLLLLLPLLAADEVPWSLDVMLKRVPPLTHDATGRWPMITWEPFRATPQDDSYQRAVPLAPELYRELAKRGLAPTIRFDVKYIPMAQAIQQAGIKVIVMEGNGGEGPGAEAPDALHHLPKDFKPAHGVHPCPLLLAGWHHRAMQVRETLQKFKDAGVTIDAAWLDWEHEPWWLQTSWEQAKQCSRCRELFPPGMLDDFDRYRAFITRYRQQLYSTYLAAPFLEYYPKCSVTNWGVVFSSPQTRTLHYWGRFWYPPMDVGLFTATNPVAYGNDIYYTLHWKNSWKNPQTVPLDVAHMDRVYTHIMLSQVSGDAANALRWAPEKMCVPWVDRYCPDEDDAKVPILSRERYREILRHIWLRGADTMQIFNAYRPKHSAIATEEIEDAVAIYDEVLPLRDFLDHGTIMNTAIPAAEDDGAIWSGLRLEREAIVRAYTQGTRPVSVNIIPWEDGPSVKLQAPPAGAYYHLLRDGNQIRVENGLPK